MPKILDISPLVSTRIATWPGDVPYTRSVTASLAQGDPIDLSAITTTVHVGAHVDAPSHYQLGGPDIASRSLDLYYGPCQVIEVAVARGQCIEERHVMDPIVAPRVLFKTGSFPNPDQWNDDFVSISPELVGALASRGVRLIGIDTPSIDPAASKTLDAHRVVAAHDMAILEGIVLDHVPEGTYQLVAFPLKLKDADASPVRAVLLAP